MPVAGVFVGLSAQDDLRIRALKYGHRDAEALHATFADANEAVGASISELHLLTNASATLASVRAALASAVRHAAAGAADLLVVHFSCHGSPSGDLILFDGDRDDIAQSCLPVSEVIDSLAQLEDTTVVLTLDCCFAGTVIGLTDSPNRDAFDGLMKQITGGSRYVVWAAEPGQAAYEDTALAHGYLSYSLLAQLDAARASSRTSIPADEWIRGAARRVDELARAAGREQQAGSYGLVKAGHSIPISPLGSHSRRIAETAGVAAVSAELDSLAAHGLQPDDIAAVRARLGGVAQLKQLQQDAISPGGVMSGRSMLVRAPTSGGKTLIAELAMLRQWRVGRKTVFLLPLRALVHEQASTVREHYGKRLNLRVVASTGEATDDDDLLRLDQYDVAFLTYEKFAALVGTRPQFLNELGVVVVDEIQTIEDQDRGRTLELLLVRLRRLRQARQWPQLIVLCGELANIDSFQAWLGLTPIGSSSRPIPLIEGVVAPDGLVREYHAEAKHEAKRKHPGLPMAVTAGRENKWDDHKRAHTALAITKHLVIDEGKQVLLFCTSRPQAMRLAAWLAEDLGLAAAEDLVSGLGQADGSQEHRASALLMEAAKHGVAFHISDLDQHERQLVEQAFRTGTVRAVVATPTLAMGVNSSTDVVLLVDNTFYAGRDVPPTPLSVPVYRNMAGRAGRLLPGGPAEGRSLLVGLHQPDADRLWAEYVRAPDAVLASRMDELSTDELALALLELHPNASAVELADDLSATYWGSLQTNSDDWVRNQRRTIEGALATLANEGLVLGPTAGKWELTPRGRAVAGFGIRVASVRCVLHAFEAIRHSKEPFDLLMLVTLAQLTVELEKVLLPYGTTSVIVPRDNRGPFRDRSDLWSIVVDPFPDGSGESAQRIGDRIHRLTGLTRWLTGSTLREIEKAYERAGDGKPVAGGFRSMVDRTVDMLPAISALAMAEFPGRKAEIQQAYGLGRNQLAVGGSAAAGRLHALRVGLSRGECLALAQKGCIDEPTLSSAIAERAADIEAVLSTPGVQQLKSRLADRKGRRRRDIPVVQMMFEGFGDITAI